MDFWLKHTSDDKILLPVNPEEFEITEKHHNTTLVINSIGEINLLGKRGLKECTISSFFPNQAYDFTHGTKKTVKVPHKKVVKVPYKVKTYSKKKKKYVTKTKYKKVTKVYYTTKKVPVPVDEPQNFVKTIETWKKKGYPIRLIIGKDVNVLCVIESFKKGQQDGTGDVYYTISLKEYREIEVVKKKKKKKKKETKKKEKKQKRTQTKKKTTKTYTVKQGDCLWNIAKKFYGNGAQYTKIYNANKDKIKNPNLIYPGQVLKIP